jgi:hypothetical protein
MQYEQACSILRWHIGFNDSPALGGKKSFIDNVQAIEKNQSHIGLDESTNEIIDCLEIVNCHINGQISSESRDKQERLSRLLVSALSGILMLCLDALIAVEQRKGIDDPSAVMLRKVAWKIECGWNGVLDGDIDNIREHIELEWASLTGR